MSQKKKYDRVKTLDDDEEDDDQKDMIADEIFHGDADGELEEGEAVDEPLHHADDDEEGEDEESGRPETMLCLVFKKQSKRKKSDANSVRSCFLNH